MNIRQKVCFSIIAPLFLISAGHVVLQKLNTTSENVQNTEANAGQINSCINLFPPQKNFMLNKDVRGLLDTLNTDSINAQHLYR